MRRPVLLLGLCAAAAPLHGGEVEVAGLRLDWSATLTSLTWHDEEGAKAISRNEQAFGVNVHTDPDRRWQVVTRVDFVAGSEMPRVRLQGDGVVEEDDQWQVRSEAAYVDVKDLLIDGLDLRVGRQVLVWGAADVFNPTDALSSKSFENPVKFGENLPSPALNLHYHVGSLDLNAIYVSHFQAPRLPPGLEQRFFTSGRIPESFQDLAREFQEQDGEVDLNLRPDVPSSRLWGLRAAANVGGLDMSLSYADTREVVPVLRKLDVLAFDPEALRATVDAETFFPRKRVYGADVAGQLPFLDDAGFWVEAAWHVPEEDVLTVEFLGAPLASDPILEDPYLKYTVGGDYTFGDGYLLQLQVVRGFIDENAKELLHTYVSAGVEKAFFTDVLRARLFEIYNTEDGGLIVNPDFLWRATDHVDVALGGLLYAGRDGSLLKETPTGDQYYVELRYAF